MALTHQPDVRRTFATGSSAWPLAVAGVLVVAVMAVIVVIATAGRREGPSVSSAGGSGVSVTDHREVAPFARVELAGANTVVIHVGAPQSVAVTGDDNLVGRVTTVVRAGRLVIDNTGSFTTKAPMHVAVSVPSLDGVELGGAGTVTVDGVTSADFSAELAGDGTLVVSGTVQRVTAVLAGAGTLDLHDLLATDGTAQLQGTGTIRVHATSTLDATLTGTGTILYRGDPTVTMRNTGTGTVVPE
jgi:Putative auto-transporter adhesin, head GIN domain